MSSEKTPPPVAPRLAISSLHFSGGQTLTFEEGEAIAFVGPNNAGKSLALREIYSQIATANKSTHKVITKIEYNRIGTESDFAAYLDHFSRSPANSTSGITAGFGYRINKAFINQFTRAPQGMGQILDFFIHRSDTIGRQSFSDTAPAVTLHLDPPTHPIHLLLEDDELESRTSHLFERAYGKELIPFRAGGNAYPMFVGIRPDKSSFPDPISKAYVEDLKTKAEPLADQGDGMRSFASIILACTVGSQHSILTLDEPEAFLHPPQARLLGRYLAEKRVKNSQLFLSTHSTDLLEGLTSIADQKVRIIRLERDGKKTNAYELDSVLVDNLATDPVAKFSGIMRGIFHEWVFITEAESDSLLYSSCIDAITPDDQKQPDVLWVHSGGKQRARRLLEQIDSSKVRTGVIVDIDVLNDRNIIFNLINSKGGNFELIESEFKIIQNFLSSKNPAFTIGQVLNKIASDLSGLDQSTSFSPEAKRIIQSNLKETSHWSILKTVGKRFFSGKIRSSYDKIESYCASIGIFIVPVGEIEAFCPSLAHLHGPEFAIQVLHQFDLAKAPELGELRDFGAKLLDYMSSKSA